MDLIEMRATRLELQWSREVRYFISRVRRDPYNVEDLFCLKVSSSVVSKLRFLCHSFYSYLGIEHLSLDHCDFISFSSASLNNIRWWLNDTELCGNWIQNRDELRVSRKIRQILLNVLFNCPCLQCSPELWTDI